MEHGRAEERRGRKKEGLGGRGYCVRHGACLRDMGRACEIWGVLAKYGACLRNMGRACEMGTWGGAAGGGSRVASSLEVSGRRDRPAGWCVWAGRISPLACSAPQTALLSSSSPRKK